MTRDRPATARITRFDEGAASWEVAWRPPAAVLRPFMHDLYGYSERADGLVRRREFPTPFIVVIFEFGPPVRVFEPGDSERSAGYAGGFVAGLDDRYTITEHDGFQRGLQFYLTPIGARLVFGRPMGELTGQVVHARDLLPREHRTFVERLEGLPTWDARFDLVEAFITERVQRAEPPNRAVTWAFGEIQRSGGAVEIARLARDLGYSQTHLVNLFRDHIGLPPKRLARLTRFARLIQHLKTAGDGSTWADLAARFGYYDQAHLVRDMRFFTGYTPTDARETLVNLG